MTSQISPEALSDAALLERVKVLVANERKATACLIAHVAELDARRLYLGQGYSSLFTYCTQALHLSEYAAYGRIETARLVRRLPAILPLLEDGSLSLTTTSLLAPVLTEENHEEVLARRTASQSGKWSSSWQRFGRSPMSGLLFASCRPATR